jgi:pilus assembly protein FimV
VTQQSGNQFEDDLTTGFEDNDSFSTDSIDLFEFAGGEESPIARLKAIILSIDWEINDDILQQLDDELVDLGDIWANDKIKLVYIQGLSKIGKYICREKANAHPNAIKLLISFYHNLEKIVSAADVMSEDEKKEILLEDVEKFDQLKTQIGKHSTDSNDVGTAAPALSSEPQNESGDVTELETLKALVLGLDWEINDQGLEQLGEEVNRLEGVFRNSKAKLILLQGIGALCSYVNKMRSKSNSKAFTLIHSFYEVLEKIPSGNLPLGEDKQLLLAEVEKFKSFKAEIVEDRLSTESAETVAKVVEATPDVIAEVSREVLPVQNDDASEVAADIESRLLSVFGDVEDDTDHIKTDKSAVLEGVNVETEADDESDEEALPFTDGVVAPALAEVNKESSFSVEKLAGDLAKSIVPEDQDVDKKVADRVVPGVDVETEADDDSDEEALPFIDGDVAPALMDSDDENGFDEAILTAEIDKSESEDLDNRLDSLFDDEVQNLSQESGSVQEDESVVEEDVQPIAALSDVDVEESEDLDNRLDSLFDDDVPDLSQESGSVHEDESVVEEDVQPIAALSDVDVDVEESEDLDNRLDSLFDDDVQDLSQESGSVHEDESVVEEDVQPIAALSDVDVEESEDLDNRLDSFFDDDVQDLSQESDSVHEDETVVEEDVQPIAALSDVDVEESEDLDNRLDSLFDDDVQDSSQESGSVREDESVVEEDVQPIVALSDVAGEENSDFPDAALTFVSGQDEDILTAIDSVEVTLEEKDEDEISNKNAESSLSFLDDDLSPADSIETGKTFEDEPDSNAEIAAFFDDSASTPALSESKEFSFEESIEKSLQEEIETEEVVFEVAGDDVEVDLLPSEEYVDSEGEPDKDETVEFSVADHIQPDSVTGTIDEPVFVDYAPLEATIQLMHGDSNDTNLQALFAEINRMKTQSASNIIGKIFLQLLSTIGQHIERNMDSPNSIGLALMDDIYSGILMSASPDVPSEQVQLHLLSCTSQVHLFLLLQKDVVTESGAIATDEAV